MGNKKVLSKATRELNKTKRFAAPKNIIEDPRGQWAHPGEITRIPSDKITMQGVPYPVMAYPNMGEPQMMYPGQDYIFPGADYVDEYPQMQEGGTTIPTVEDSGSMNEDGFWVPDWEAIAMQAKQLNAKTVKTKSGVIIYFDDNWQVQSVDENPQMKKGGTPKYQDGGLMTQDEIDGATEGMMKARLAYAHMHGNPAAQRMVVAPDQPYVFDDGNTGTHFMASMDNYAVPLIQDVNGQLMLGDFGPESAEAIRFDNPEDAMYFAENYKQITPDESYRKENPEEDYIEAELTEEEIEEYRRGGWVVEELDTYPRGGGLGKGKGEGKGKGKGSTKFKPKGNVAPFVTSNPEEYAYRKAAYEDSLSVANTNNRIMPKPKRRETYYRPFTNYTIPHRTINPRKTKTTIKTNTGTASSIFDQSERSKAWRKYLNDQFIKGSQQYPIIENYPVAWETKSNFFPRGINIPFIGDTEEGTWHSATKPRYQPPRQKVIFQEPPVPSKTKPKPKEHQYPTEYKPVVNNIPPGISKSQLEKTGVIIGDKAIVGYEEVQQLDPTTGKVTTVRNPIYEDLEKPMPTLRPTRVDPRLIEFTGNPESEMETDEFSTYPTPDGGADWVGRTERYVDWNGNKIPYRLPRFRKPGHGGDLIRQGKKRYIPLPSIESRYQAEIVPEEEYQEGGSPDPKTNFYTVQGSDGVYRKVNGKWEVDWNRSGKFQPLSKGDIKERSTILNKKAQPLYDSTYDDIYTTQNTAYTAPPKASAVKPTVTKKPTAQDKAAQEQFDKAFAVPIKSKKEIVENKIQKGIDDYVKYHQQQTGKPLTQEEYDDAYQDIYNRAYVDAGVYSGTTSRPVANPYGTTEERKNLVSLDPGKAPKNLTVGDYVDKGWDVVTNPLDYASYALKPKGTVTTPWNMTNYENRLEAAGLEDPVTANNNVNKAIDFASWFIGPGMVAQGLKMVPGTVNSIGRAFENPSWENTGDALFDAGMTALSIAPGFGIAKNLAKPASTIDDLKAIEALRGNTATTPFQSYYLTGNRALGTSEAAVQQAEALRKFTGQQPLELPAGEYQFSNSDYKKLYDELQEAIKKQKIESDELANFDPIAKINESKVDNKTFKDLIMGDDLKFKFDDYPDSPRIPVRYAGLEQIRPGSGPMSLNRTADLLPKGSSSSKNPLDQLAALIRGRRSKSELSALDDLDTTRLQSKTGQENAARILDEEITQKLKDLDTPEGRRRVEKYIKDNNIVNEAYDPGNYDEMVKTIDNELPEILKNKYSDESRRIVELVKNNMIVKKRSPQLMANIKSWNELEPEHILNNPLLNRISVTDILVPADPRFTGGIAKRPLTHDEYVQNIENTFIEDIELDISEKRAQIKLIENNIKQLATEKNMANAALRSGNIISAEKIQKVMADYNTRILAEHNKIAQFNNTISGLDSRLQRNNASFLRDVYNNQYNDFVNLVSIGEPLTTLGDIMPTIVHEVGHHTEGVGLGRKTNSAIDRELIANLDFARRAPSYLYKKFDLDEVEKTLASDISFDGVDKYRNPTDYFKRNLGYFKTGSGKTEPTAFAVEMRPALKELGLIKGNYDIITPETIEKLYTEYTTNPKFRFKDIRIFDIIKPTKKNFKVLAKNYNDLKGLLPYAVPVGLGVGAASLPQEQDGGIVTSVTDDEINKYIKEGYIVEEYQDGGQTNLNQYFTVPGNYRPTTKPSEEPAPKTVIKNNKPDLNQYLTVPDNYKETVIVDQKPEVVNEYNFSEEYPFINKDVVDNILAQLPRKKSSKTETKKKPAEPTTSKSMMEVLSQYNVSGQSPFLTTDDLNKLPKYAQPKKDSDARFAEGKKKAKEKEVVDSGILDAIGVLANPAFEYLNPALSTAYDSAKDYLDLAWNGIKRKAQTYGVIDDSDIRVKPLSLTAPLSIDDYYKDRNPIRQQVLDIPKGNGRTYKQQVVPLSNVTVGYRNRGDYSKDIKTSGLELTTFHPFTSKPKSVTDNTSVFAVDGAGNLHTGKYGDLKNNADWKFSPTFMNKIKDIRSDFQDGSVSGNPGYQQPKVTVIENGKEKVGSINLLTKGKGKEDFYGSIQGGRVLFVNPDTKEQYLVSGSLNHIKSEFKRLKGKAPYLEAWTLDNGTYSRGLSYKDGVLTKDRLKAYDNENISGGSGLYITDYKAPITRYEEKYIKGTPNIRTTNSDSYKSGSPLKNEVKNIVLHHTAFTDPVKNNQGVYNHFMNPTSQASAHVVIEEDGKRTVYASPEQVTFHAGKSSWNGRSNVNDFGIGVEFQGDTNKQPLTEAQIESFVEYFDDIATKYNLSTKDIITHAMVAPGRKPDITNKEYQRILKYMKSKGYK
jgi:hypothetical protein